MNYEIEGVPPRADLPLAENPPLPEEVRDINYEFSPAKLAFVRALPCQGGFIIAQID